MRSFFSLVEASLLKILVIVPQLPPLVNGVGDYSLTLAQQMFTRFGVTTHFIVCDPSYEFNLSINGISLEVLQDLSQESLSLSLDKSPRNSTVLLQFSGYGYAKWACPHWLVNGLQDWKNKNPEGYLLTMFHEVYNIMGKPWQHNFWVSGTQKQIASQLSILSDICFTTTQEYSKTLSELSKGKHLNPQVLSVFSNIGEPLDPSPISQRKRRLAVFGQHGTRRHAYIRSLSMLKNACETLEIDKIFDIGSPINMDLSKIDNLPPIVEVGRCDSQTVCEILSNSIAGFLDYDIRRLSKSGIFAAYCACGVLPVLHCGYSGIRDGLISGDHYWAANTSWIGNYSINSAQRIASQANHWYSGHSIQIHADKIINSFKKAEYKARS